MNARTFEEYLFRDIRSFGIWNELKTSVFNRTLAAMCALARAGTSRLADPADDEVAQDDKRVNLFALAPQRNVVGEAFARHGSEKFMRTSDKPVLLLNAEPKISYGRILVPVDFSAQAKAAARAVLRLYPAAQIVFLHAFRVPEEGGTCDTEIDVIAANSRHIQARETAIKELHRFTDELGATGRLISHVVHYGLPMPVICGYAGKMSADMIAIVKRKNFPYGDFLRGGNALRLARQTACDVLVVPMTDQ